MAHPRLTPGDIREAFQSAIPRRRDEFRQLVRDLKYEHTRRDTVFSRYVVDVARAAKEELHARFDAADRLVEMLIDDGWEPSSAEMIDSVYQSLFTGFGSTDRDPIGDLYNVVSEVFSDLGGNGRDIRDSFANELMDTQVNAYKAAVAALKLHRPGKPHAVFNAPVGSVAFGDGNTANVVQELSE